MKEMRELAAKHAQAMREQAMAMAKKRKEEFIGARVPKELRDKIIQRAEREGVSVSILVRQILEHAFNESVAVSSTMSGQREVSVKQAAAERFKNKFAHVLGWKAITLNTHIHCAGCDKELNEGDTVTVGLSSTGGSPVVLCKQCKDAV